jgi:hypothetical protein
MSRYTPFGCPNAVSKIDVGETYEVTLAALGLPTTF